MSPSVETSAGKASSGPKLARNMTEDELSSLSRYLTGLQKEPRERVLLAVAANPAKIHALSSERVREAVVGSEDQAAAVNMMLRTNAAFDPDAIGEDLELAVEGRINPILLWEKHPVVIIAGLVLALLLMLMLRRLLFARPRRAAAPCRRSAAEPAQCSRRAFCRATRCTCRDNWRRAPRGTAASARKPSRPFATRWGFCNKPAWTCRTWCR